MEAIQIEIDEKSDRQEKKDKFVRVEKHVSSRFFGVIIAAVCLRLP
jgi:hypothetical protein